MIFMASEKILLISSVTFVNISENQSTPHFLDNGENPGAVLVSQVLTGENYPNWCRSMEMTLSA